MSAVTSSGQLRCVLQRFYSFLCFKTVREHISALTDKCEEMMQLHEAVFTARARLKQAELEAEQWKEELRRLQTHSQEQGQQIHTLRQERQTSQEKTNRFVCLLSLRYEWIHRDFIGIVLISV